MLAPAVCRRALSLLLLLCLVGCAASAEPPRAVDPMFGLGDRESFSFRSDRLDRDFHVLVRLPRSYGEGDRDYPMVFLLDGGILFPMLSPFQLMMEVEGSADEVILVGISYGGLGFSNGNLRGTDYTAASPEIEYFGGAADFAAFLGEQLLPELRARYRIDAERRVLLGQSLGGQFAIFGALTRPELFSTWVAVNPAIHANLAMFLELAAQPDAPPTELVLALGSDDTPRYRDAAVDWLSARRADPDPGVALKLIELPGAHHATSAPAAYFAVVRRIAPAPAEAD